MILRKVSSKELGQTYSRGADFCGPVNQRRVSDGSVGWPGIHLWSLILVSSERTR